MKLAERIAEGLYPIGVSTLPSWVARMERRRKIAIPIIATHLEPVRDAIKYAVSFHATGVGQLSHVLAGLEVALSKLGDGEES